jgi:hypothetical protein
MNLKELRNGLWQLSDPEFVKFVQDFGGSSQDREGVVRNFVDHPEHERRLCQLLDIATEEEKLVQATLASASSAKLSAIVAVIATAIALIALVVTIYGVLK